MIWRGIEVTPKPVLTKDVSEEFLGYMREQLAEWKLVWEPIEAARAERLRVWFMRYMGMR